MPALAAASVAAGSLSLLNAAPVFAAGASIYAAATGGTGSTCSLATSCTLSQALLNAQAGDTILLTTPGSAAHYVGNWKVSTTGTTSSLPLTIEPAAGVFNPILDGNFGSSSGCSTSACDGSILHVAAGASLTVENVSIEDGKNTTSNGGAGNGGAIEADGGGTVVVIGVTFTSNSASIGGAIDNGGGLGNAATLVVVDSTFNSNSASTAGGAIATDVLFGGAAAVVLDSTFSSNTATTYGGAIDNGYFGGNGILYVTTSTFSSNSAGSGGAIGNATYQSSGTAIVLSSTFASNSGDIDTGVLGGTSTVALGANIFASSCGQSGTWSDYGYNVGTNSSCFSSGVNTDSADSALASQLGPLAPNGGLTQTIEPLTGNPAVAKIPNPATITIGTAKIALCPAVDQRGVASPPPPTDCNSGAVQPGSTAPSMTPVNFVADTPPAIASICSPYSYAFTASPAGTAFSVASGSPPSGLTLSPGGVLSGVPNLTGTYTFSVSAAAGGMSATSPSISITVSATGCTSGGQTLSGTVLLSPSAVSFGTTPVGGTSSAQVFVLTSFNSGLLTINSASVGAPFHIVSTNCPGTLAYLGSCYVLMDFAPTSAGPISGGLDIFDTATSSPQVVVLSGTGS